MATPTVKTKKADVKKKLEVGNFFSTKVSVDNEFVTIRLPIQVADYLNLKGHDVFWSPVNGVIQISGNEPHMVIPSLNVSADAFVAHR